MKVESKICQINDSFVTGTNDREACPKRWVAALVQMNCERKVAAKLDKMGIANYVPVQQEKHQWSDRKKKIDRIVILYLQNETKIANFAIFVSEQK